MLAALGAQSLNHCTAREVLLTSFPFFFFNVQTNINNIFKKTLRMGCGVGNGCFIWTVSVWGEEEVLEVDGGDGCTTV